MADTKPKTRIEELYEALKKEIKYLPQITRDQPLEDPFQTISNIYDNTFLHLAIHFKQKDLVKELFGMLPEQIHPSLWNKKNKEGNTILHELACSDSMKNLAQEALKICKDKDSELLTVRNKLGETPIFCAARHGQTEMFKFLAEKMKLKVVSVEAVMSPPEEMKLEELQELLNSQHHLQRDDKTTVLHISITTECFGLAAHIAESYSYLINEKDQDSMTALRYFACSSSAFGMQTKGRELIVACIKSKSNQDQGFIDMINAATEELRNSDWSLENVLKKSEERMHCQRLAQILAKVDTSWDASGDDQNPMEKASESSPKQEGEISQGSTSTSENNKSVENPLLLATISNIPDIVKAILDCQPQVLEHTNKKCEENPLFLATISNIPEIIKAILDRHPQAPEQTNKSHEDPLFLATISNIPEIVRWILIFHPQAIEHTNKEEMNILHVAILYRHISIFDMVVKEFEVLSRGLLSATDNKGNSLLHMFGQKGKSQMSEKMQNPAFQLRRELLSFEKVKKACQVHVTKPLNKENKTAEELFVTRNEKLHREAKEWLMRATENCTLLSVFIATVAFAAAYTVPGGPDQNTGIPILSCKPFFVVFIIADVISLTLALASVGIFLSIFQSSFLLVDFKNYLFDKLIQGITCLIFSVLVMAVAFGATIILTMKHNWKKAVWPGVAFLPVPIFILSYSPLRSVVQIKKLLKEVLKSIEGVALVALIILLGHIIRLCRACMELFNTVAKACEFIICKPVRWICCQQTAAPGTEV